MVRGWKGLWAFILRLPWYRFAAGVVAGSAGLLVTFVLRLLGLGVFLPEVAVEFVVGRIPGQIESFFIRSLGEGAKLLALLTALIVFLILPGIYAVFFRRVQVWLTNRWFVLGFYALSSAGIILLGVLPILEAGFFGSKTEQGAGFATFSQFLASLIYAGVLDHILVDVAAEYPEGFGLSRRQFIVGTIGAVAIAGLALYGLGTLVAKKGRLVFASVAEMFSKEVTPTSEFYVVTKNVIDPTVDAASWQLTIGGLVTNPRSYSYADLLALASVAEFVTLECVSNEVGGNLISNTKWTGVPLASLLQAAGPSNADWIVFTCVDGYTAAVPLAKAMDSATLVAVKMYNPVTGLDEPLPTAHGYPARIIVPGLYGMFHAKWITRIDAVNSAASSAYIGYWQQKGWTNSDYDPVSGQFKGRIHTVAIIATPPDNAVVRGKTVTIGGVAFAGDRGILGVEVSTDRGMTWTPAIVRAPLSGLSWVLWTFDWNPPRSGSFLIMAQATDGTRLPQDSIPQPPFPNGASGIDSITLLVG